jgi:hypothetical protein
VSDNTQPRLDEVWVAWTDDRKLWAAARGGPETANLQAQWPDGTWGSIGDFLADGTVTNPNVAPELHVEPGHPAGTGLPRRMDL